MCTRKLMLSHWRIMVRFRSIWPICVVFLCAALAGCRGATQFGSGVVNNGNSSVVLAMTDTPPSNVSILSAEVTLTGATLMPGNVSLFSGSTTVELTRLQTDIAYLATATNIPSGNYTSLVLTFANPMLTIENDTPSLIVSGTACAVGAICTISPTATANLSTSIPLSSFTIGSSSAAGLLIDVNLDNLLSATLGADFNAGTSVSSFTPAGIGAPPVGAEDVVGQIGNINATSNTFTLTNATGSYSLKADGTSTYFQFPGGVCSAPGFGCLRNNQIASVDIAIQSDGMILARNILFEDADGSDAEVEGMIAATNAGSQQFDMVIQTMSAPVSGLTIGQHVTVQYSATLPTPFDVDFLHVDHTSVDTSSFTASFVGPADLVAGQQVSIRRNSGSSGSLNLADRVRLRSSRITATVQSVGSSLINLTNLPSLFFGHGGVTQIIAQTSVIPATIYYEINTSINATTDITNDVVSVRGPLFNTGGINRTLLTTKVVLKP